MHNSSPSLKDFFPFNIYYQSWIGASAEYAFPPNGRLGNAKVRDSELGNSANQFMQAGKLVPDELVVGLMLAELTKVRTTPWILDGFPRTREQAEVLHKEEKLDFVVSLEVPDDVIIDRIKGRWTHLPSGRIYHTEFKPPEVPGKDDITGDDLVQREDDKPESVRKRLEMYRAKTHPLKEFYDVLGILRVFHGTESNVIYPRVHNFLKDLIPAYGGPF
ncbi:adenylate kinase 3 isoform X2 [Oratosquilla oratoria]|uniref:adenylate kinase 3 isoform X2 n=1 Tax=Oratosquilla oratoria TaxID=337810 RepID=UPI003F76C3B7